MTKSCSYIHSFIHSFMLLKFLAVTSGVFMAITLKSVFPGLLACPGISDCFEEGASDMPSWKACCLGKMSEWVKDCQSFSRRKSQVDHWQTERLKREMQYSKLEKKRADADLFTCNLNSTYRTSLSTLEEGMWREPIWIWTVRLS